MRKHELTLEDKKKIETSNMLDPQKAPERELDYLEGLSLAIELIKNGEAVSEIGKTESGAFVWLKIHRIDRETNEKKEVILYTDKTMGDIETFVKVFYKNGVEPEFVTVEE